jgi:hypothetical protein
VLAVLVGYHSVCTCATLTPRAIVTSSPLFEDAYLIVKRRARSVIEMLSISSFTCVMRAGMIFQIAFCCTHSFVSLRQHRLNHSQLHRWKQQVHRLVPLQVTQQHKLQQYRHWHTAAKLVHSWPPPPTPVQPPPTPAIALTTRHGHVC